MPGTAEPVMRRAQPGSLDLFEVDPANCLRRQPAAATGGGNLVAAPGSDKTQKSGLTCLDASRCWQRCWRSVRRPVMRNSPYALTWYGRSSCAGPDPWADEGTEAVRPGGWPGKTGSVGERGRGHRSHLSQDSTHRKVAIYVWTASSRAVRTYVAKSRTAGSSLARFNRTGHPATWAGAEWLGPGSVGCLGDVREVVVMVLTGVMDHGFGERGGH